MNQTPIDIPLSERSKEELLTILERYREELKWYVSERNRLIAQIEDANRLDQALQEITRQPELPCHLCGRPGTHHFPDSSGAWVCEDAPHCDEKKV